MPHRSIRVAPLLGALLVACVAPAVAGIPYSRNCTMPERLVACPSGDVEYRVVVRDIANVPVSNCAVTLRFGFFCLSTTFCPDQPAGVTWDPVNGLATVTSDGNGVASFHLKAGGVCDQIEISACGQVIHPGDIIGPRIIVATPDQDGNLVVNGADATFANGLLGRSDLAALRADFDGDGIVTAADLAFVTDQHPSHACDGIVPARPWTWGTLKLRYR